MSKEKLAETIEDVMMEYIIKNLPHGSGINCEWECENKKESFIFTNSYHCMNDDGYYDGWQDFKIVVPKNDWADFSLHFTGSRKEKYIILLREYLETIFYDSLDNAEEKLKEIISNESEKI